MHQIPLHGKCQAFCPLNEEMTRVQTHELSRFEQPRANFQGLVAIKKYRRAAAGRDVWNASEFRPPHVLLRTLKHLFTTVLSWPQSGFNCRKCAQLDEFLAVYHFVNDRVRSIRQDFTVQRIEDVSLVTALQQITRFYLVVRLRSVQLFGGSKAQQDWSDRLNDEQLMSALSQLETLYRMHEFVPESDQDDSERKDAEEFIGYDLLLHADEPQHVAWMLRKHSSKLRSLPMVQRALRTCVALQTDDFNAFFIEFHAMTLLEQAASLRHLVKVWTRSLHMMNKSFGKQDRFSLEELARWMNLADPNSQDESGQLAERLCNGLNIQTQRYPPSLPPPPQNDAGRVVESWELINEDLADQVVSRSVAKPSSLGFAQFKHSPVHDQLDLNAVEILLCNVALRIEKNSAQLSITELIMGTV